MRHLLPVIALPLLLVTMTSTVHAGKLYKWVAEDGSVYYSDKVPPKAITGAHSKLNASGIEVESRGAAKTAEEIAKERQEEYLREQQELLLEKQKIKDTTLLKTFRSVDDIILARDGKLATYDTQIKLTHKNIVNLKTRLLNLQERAAQYERQGKKTDDKLIQGINNTNAEIQDSYASILRRERDKELIYKEYEENIIRFRELRHLKAERIKEAQVKSGGDINSTDFSLVQTAIVCESTQQCNDYWKAAREYGKKYATTGTQLDAPNIYLSKPPTTTDDISVTVSRVRPKKEGKEVIFLDIKCKPTISGIELCNSKRLEEARQKFKATVTKTE